MLTLIFAAAAFLAKGEPYAPQKVEVVDADTLRVDGTKVRTAHLDAPERGPRAKCDAERFLAIQAFAFAMEMASTRPLVIWPERRADRYGRPLVRVTVAGKDWGEAMIAESLAGRWEGERHDWCAVGKSD